MHVKYFIYCTVRSTAWEGLAQQSHSQPRLNDYSGILQNKQALLDKGVSKGSLRDATMAQPASERAPVDDRVGVQVLHRQENGSRIEPGRLQAEAQAWAGLVPEKLTALSKLH